MCKSMRYRRYAHLHRSRIDPGERISKIWLAHYCRITQHYCERASPCWTGKRAREFTSHKDFSNQKNFSATRESCLPYRYQTGVSSPHNGGIYSTTDEAPYPPHIQHLQTCRSTSCT